MSDLIKREELLDYLQIIPIDLGYREIEDVVTFVEKMKSVDAVEVVRCEYCMNRSPDYYCPEIERDVFKDFFCENGIKAVTNE